ncbi:hypothetical protein Tco_0986642, partial [Tanacetum coccineum]
VQKNRLEATREYTEDEINVLARGGKLRGHIPGVGHVDKSLKSMHRKVDFIMSLFRSDNKYADMFKEFESGGASGSGRCSDDEESGDDEDDDGESCGESIHVLVQKDSPETCRLRGKCAHRWTYSLTENEWDPYLSELTGIIVWGIVTLTESSPTSEVS